MPCVIIYHIEMTVSAQPLCHALLLHTAASHISMTVSTLVFDERWNKLFAQGEKVE